jgi:hypothetical protein
MGIAWLFLCAGRLNGAGNLGTLVRCTQNPDPHQRPFPFPCHRSKDGTTVRSRRNSLSNVPNLGPDGQKLSESDARLAAGASQVRMWSPIAERDLCNEGNSESRCGP